MSSSSLLSLVIYPTSSSSSPPLKGNRSSPKTEVHNTARDAIYYLLCLKNSINFKIQNHQMKLVEMEGSHVVQNNYDALDVHVGQCYSVLVTADKKPKDYYMVAWTRFTKSILTVKGIMSYEGGKGPASLELPKAPVEWAWSLNQFCSFRWKLTASAARPNPRVSYHYGKINITRTVKFVNLVHMEDSKLLYAINGVSHVNLKTPLKLAKYYRIADKVFKHNLISDEPPTRRAFSLGIWMDTPSSL